MGWLIRVCAAVGPALLAYSAVFAAILGLANLAMALGGGTGSMGAVIAGLVVFGILVVPGLRAAGFLNRALRLYMAPVMELDATRRRHRR